MEGSRIPGKILEVKRKGKRVDLREDLEQGGLREQLKKKKCIQLQDCERREDGEEP